MACIKRWNNRRRFKDILASEVDTMTANRLDFFKKLQDYECKHGIIPEPWNSDKRVMAQYKIFKEKGV